MYSELIMKSDVLDIVFEKRNKMYGAYTLRKYYNNRLIKSIGVTMGVVTILSAFTFIPKKKDVVTPVTEVLMYTLTKPKVPDVKKELPKQSIKSNKASQKLFATPAIVDDKIKPDTLQEIKQTDLTGTKNIIVPRDEGPGIIGEPIAGTGGGRGEAPKPTTVLEDVSQPIDNPEIEPAYPGGINALREFLERNLINPTAMEEGEMVAVHVKFVLGYDGKLQKFTVVKDGGNIYNNEVIRVLKKMPQWIPGKSKGQNVAVNFTIPIKFVPAD
jgi:protein TonB